MTLRNILRVFLLVFFLTSVPCPLSCNAEVTAESEQHSYSVCKVKVLTGFDALNQVEFKFNGYAINSCSRATVCLRRICQDGRIKSYDEIIYTCPDPHLSITYHTYKKLRSDESGVKLYWLELTDSASGKTTRYTNWK